MAQLSDDCFAFGGPMMSVDEAVGLIATRVTPLVDVETVMLARKFPEAKIAFTGGDAGILP